MGLPMNAYKAEAYSFHLNIVYSDINSLGFANTLILLVEFLEQKAYFIISYHIISHCFVFRLGFKISFEQSSQRCTFCDHLLDFFCSYQLHRRSVLLMNCSVKILNLQTYLLYCPASLFRVYTTKKCVLHHLDKA